VRIVTPRVHAQSAVRSVQTASNVDAESMTRVFGAHVTDAHDDDGNDEDDASGSGSGVDIGTAKDKNGDEDEHGDDDDVSDKRAKHGDTAHVDDTNKYLALHALR
jgi:hypothetical protein